MQHSPVGEANIRLASQEIPRILRNPTGWTTGLRIPIGHTIFLRHNL
jgi:hypothetical protein